MLQTWTILVQFKLLSARIYICRQCIYRSRVQYVANETFLHIIYLTFNLQRGVFFCLGGVLSIVCVCIGGSTHGHKCTQTICITHSTYMVHILSCLVFHELDLFISKNTIAVLFLNSKPFLCSQNNDNKYIWIHIRQK